MSVKVSATEEYKREQEEAQSEQRRFFPAGARRWRTVELDTGT